MQRAHDQFLANIARAKHIHSLHGAMVKMVTPAVDLSDILRAEIVMVVSALDHYVHEVVRLGMLDIYEGRRVATPAFRKFRIPVSALSQQDPAALLQNLDSEIRSQHGYLAFQQPDKIADAIRLISGVSLWQEVASKTRQDAGSVKTHIQLLVERRNKIAHEADSDPSFPETRWPVTEDMVADSIGFVESVCLAIHEVIQ